MYTNPQRLLSEETRELRKAAGAWLRGVRERQGLTQHDVGTFAGYRYYTQYSALEQGTGRVPPERYAWVAAALGVEARFFARKLMRFYDPITFSVLLNETDVDHKYLTLREPMVPPDCDPKVGTLQAKELRQKAGVLIKTLREDAGLTQVDIAERMGYKFYTRVSQIERGIGRVPPEELIDFAQALNVVPAHLVSQLVKAYDPVVYLLAFDGSGCSHGTLAGKVT